ncbi:MOSC domain containing protein [Pyrenophora tritici-repentis Pt-1C-BFP]|uniref:MOSC domain containing protein n=2 Tax=Pyrenophora tritici-repentis TaxID=45151 RepID=B2VUA2_PYRTR|nr:MOSC domain containing protein [Pyrenophora tritici-repentis Pt-1C-BFP]EDU41513.1 MOSC domain containing protein [Pyrenophora tritici-repentis Pt-1C-BFP]
MEEESGFDIDKVSPIWIVTALCIVPLGLYYMLNLLSPLMHRFTDMKISEIYVYPIKSLRTLPMKEAIATPQGFKHDRTFMLLQKTDSGYKNMAVSNYPEMTQFLQILDLVKSTITVTYLAYGDNSKQSTIQVPLIPDTEPLDPIEITMHSSPTSAYIMPDNYNTWFSSHLGYPVLLVYLSTNRRRVLFQDMQTTEPSTLSRTIKTYIPIPTALLPSSLLPPPTSPPKITFADCAPYLICSKTSLSNVSDRLPPGSTMDITKFRPNLVVSGAAEPFEEDYWARVLVGGKTEILLKHNCVRCKSINVDYGTGKPGQGPEGEVLKKLQGDRRVDQGMRWSPVFGRYAFWGGGENGKKGKAEEVVWRVGDRVRVVGTNNRRTVSSWPNLG